MQAFLKAITIFLLLFLGFGAIYGGWILISDPSGAKFQWSLDLLKGTPFKNFLIPGIILFIMNGILPVIISILIIVKAKYYEWLIIIQGCILIVWLSAEIIFNKDLFAPTMHYPSYAVGILLIGTGTILSKTNKK